jgi:hypothetical protein
MRVAIGWVMLSCLVLACTGSTEPSTNPREQRTDPGETGRVSGRVVTSGIVQATGASPVNDGGDSATGRWVEVGPLAGEAIRASQPLARVVVELGIVHFDRSSDSVAEGTSRSLVIPMVVPDVWAGPANRILDPGPAAPPGRFEVIARATTNRRGEFRFSGAPRGQFLMVRARPRAPYLETYSKTPFWLGNEPSEVVEVIVREEPTGQ